MKEETLFREIIDTSIELKKMQSAQINMEKKGIKGDAVSAMASRAKYLEGKRDRLKELIGPVTSLPAKAETVFEKEFLYE